MRQECSTNVRSSKDTSGKPNPKRFAALSVITTLVIWLTVGCTGSSIPTVLLPKPGATATPSAPIRNNPDPKASKPMDLEQGDLSTPEPTATSSNSEAGPENPETTDIQPLPTSTPPRPDPPPDMIYTSDLLYISEGQLMRWDHMTGYSGMLVDKVDNYAASSSGRRVSAIHPLFVRLAGENHVRKL